MLVSQHLAKKGQTDSPTKTGHQKLPQLELDTSSEAHEPKLFGVHKKKKRFKRARPASSRVCLSGYHSEQICQVWNSQSCSRSMVPHSSVKDPVHSLSMQ